MSRSGRYTKFIILFVSLGLTARAQMMDFAPFYSERQVSAARIGWEQIGPGNSGYVNGLWFNRYQPDAVFVSPDMNDSYRSFDLGKRWKTLKDWDGTGGDKTRFSGVEFSALDPDTGILIGRRDLSVTHDGGASWSDFPDAPWYGFGASYNPVVSCAAIDPQTTNVWFVGAGGHQRRQRAFGTMTEVSEADPHGLGTPYLSGRIYKTIDSGENWSYTTNGLNPLAEFCRIVVHPADSSTVFAASNYGFYKSSDGGESWAELSAGLDNDVILDFDYHWAPENQPGDQLTFYVINQVRYELVSTNGGQTVVSSGGLFRSSDMGQTWQKCNGAPVGLHQDLTQLSSRTNVRLLFYSLMAKWFSSFADKDEAEAALADHLPTDALPYINAVAIDPTDRTRVYVSHLIMNNVKSFPPGMIWRTDDSGATWQSVLRYSPSYAGYDSAYWEERGNPTRPNMKLSHKNSINQSDQNYAQGGIRGMDVNARGEIMALCNHLTVLSTNCGVSWVQVDEDETEGGNWVGRGDSNIGGQDLLQDYRLGPNRVWFGTGEHNMWQLRDDGDDVAPGKQALKVFAGATPSVTEIGIHPDDPQTLYTLAMRQTNAGRFMQSTDGGESWSVLGTPLQYTGADNPKIHMNSILVDPIHPEWIYFGVSDNAYDSNAQGVYRSSDGGVTWQQANLGLLGGAADGNPPVASVAFDPSDPEGKTLWAGVLQDAFDGGVYKSVDRGSNWVQVASVPSNIVSVNQIYFDGFGRIFVSSGKNWGYPDDGGIWKSEDEGKSWTRIFAMPYTQRIDVSPHDPGRMLAVVADEARIGHINPGIYYSGDNSVSWVKANQGNGHPGAVMRAEFDLFDPQRLWMTCGANGFSRGALDLGWSNAPVAQVGGDRVYWDHDDIPGEIVHLNAHGCFISEGRTSTVEWRNKQGELLSTDAELEMALPGGESELLLTVTDSSLQESTETVSLMIHDPVPATGSGGLAYADTMPAGRYRVSTLEDDKFDPSSTNKAFVCIPILRRETGKSRTGGQSFSVLDDFNLGRVVCRLGRADPLDTDMLRSEGMNLSIVAFSNGAPDHVAYSEDFLFSSAATPVINGYDYMVFTLSSPVSLVAGNSYALVFWHTDVQGDYISDLGLMWSERDANIYSGGTGYDDSWSDSSTLDPVTDYPLLFPLGASPNTRDLAFGLVEYQTPYGGYTGWVYEHGYYGADAFDLADPDGDGVGNLVEYGLGGNPVDSESPGTGLSVGRSGDFLELAHVLRNDTDELDYRLEQAESLISNDWNAVSFPVVGTNDLSNGYSEVINQVPLDWDGMFIRLMIERKLQP